MDLRRSPLLLLLLLLVLLSVASSPVAADTHTDCGVAQTAFSFCVPYVAGLERTVSPKCCMGVKAVEELASVTGDGQGMCKCLRKLLVSAGVGGSGSRAEVLPRACGVRTRVVPTSLHDGCAW